MQIKRFLLIINIIILFSVALVACSGSGNEIDTHETTDNTSPEAHINSDNGITGSDYNDICEAGDSIAENQIESPDENTDEPHQVAEEKDIIMIDDPEIQELISNLLLYNDIFINDNYIALDENQKDPSNPNGRLCRVIQEEIDTWDKWTNYIYSVFDDELAEKNIGRFQNNDNTVYAAIPFYGPRYSMFRYNIYNDDMGNVILGCRCHWDPTGLDPQISHFYYILKHTDNGWRIKYCADTPSFVIKDDIAEYWTKLDTNERNYYPAEYVINDIDKNEINELVDRLNRVSLLLEGPIMNSSVNWSGTDPTDPTGIYYRLRGRSMTWEEWSNLLHSVFDEDLADFIKNNSFAIIEYDSQAYAKACGGSGFAECGSLSDIVTDDMGNVIITCENSFPVPGEIDQYDQYTYKYMLKKTKNGWRIRYRLGCEYSISN